MKIFVLFLFLFQSCAYFDAVSSKKSRGFGRGLMDKKQPQDVPELKGSKVKRPTRVVRRTGPERIFQLKDQSGTFVVRRVSGSQRGSGNFVVKSSLEPMNSPGKIVEKSVSISKRGKIKDKTVIVPSRSQYTVWFEKKKFFTELSFDGSSRSLNVKMKSPEPDWNGSRSYSIPKGSGVFCFFSQIVDCAREIGFVSKATSSNGGKMNFYVLWDGYPYFHDQYTNLRKEPFSAAILSYDGESEDGNKRFSLNFQQQVIYFFVDGSSQLSKVFWVSQGLSMTPQY